MNFLIINWQDWKNPYAGGAEVYLYEIFSRLHKNGHRIVLLCSRAKGQGRYERLDGFEIYRIGNRQNFNFIAPAAMRMLLRHRSFDVIIDDLNKIPFYSPLFTRVRVVPMLMHLFRRTIFREANPVIASYVFAAERIIPFGYGSRDFVAISKSTAEDLRAIGIGGVIHVVPCGIPRQPKVSSRRSRDLVAYVGRVKRYKSIDHFVRAIPFIRERCKVKAAIVGDGDACAGLKELSRELGVTVDFPGFVSEKEKYLIYSKTRVVVQPSIKEGWGLTAIEAQACGTPVVCADSPGLREVVLDGETGFLYPYGDIRRMAERVVELIKDDKKWQRFSRAAKAWAGQFSWDRAADRMERVLLGRG
jgi:glycosyltransferase involved in cell wall biosynthesis